MHPSEEVLAFWFPDLAEAGHVQVAAQFEWWFRGGADADIHRRFVPLLERAAGGELNGWAHEPRSRLALIVVLDQFSRSIHRDSARAYAQDAQALALTLEGLDAGHYAALRTSWERTFFMMPLGHAESLVHLDHAVELAEALAREAPPPLRRILEHSASQARGHRDVIARFGRQPHRNALLGRESTPAEREYLAAGKLVHTRGIPG